VAAVDLKQARLLALLDVGKTPAHLALKPEAANWWSAISTARAFHL